MENISLNFLQESHENDEDKEIQTAVVDAIYEDFLAFFKTEKQFWLDYILVSLKQNPEFKNEKTKKLAFKAMKIWVGVNKKTVRKVFPLDMIYGGYEKIVYDTETKKAEVVRKADFEEDFGETEGEGTCEQ